MTTENLLQALKYKLTSEDIAKGRIPAVHRIIAELLDKPSLTTKHEVDEYLRAVGYDPKKIGQQVKTFVDDLIRDYKKSEVSACDVCDKCGTVMGGSSYSLKTYLASGECFFEATGYPWESERQVRLKLSSRVSDLLRKSRAFEMEAHRLRKKLDAKSIPLRVRFTSWITQLISDRRESP
jgi:hypothetical protein